jgi:hypothetical protein
VRLYPKLAFVQWPATIAPVETPVAPTTIEITTQDGARAGQGECMIPYLPGHRVGSTAGRAPCAYALSERVQIL